MHLSKIVKDLDVNVRIAARRLKEINMLGWHQYRSELPKGFHEESDEVMLALYKLNELIFEARVVYPLKVYTYETEQYECGVTLTVLTYSTLSYVTSTPVIPDHSLLSVTNLVNVATFTHCIACLFTAVTYNKI